MRAFNSIFWMGMYRPRTLRRSLPRTDGRKWTAEKEEGERERGLAGLAEVRSRAIHEFGRRAIGERERERQFEFRRKLGGRAISKSSSAE